MLDLSGRLTTPATQWAIWSGSPGLMASTLCRGWQHTHIISRCLQQPLPLQSACIASLPMLHSLLVPMVAKEATKCILPDIRPNQWEQLLLRCHPWHDMSCIFLLTPNWHSFAEGGHVFLDVQYNANCNVLAWGADIWAPMTNRRATYDAHPLLWRAWGKKTIKQYHS